MLKAITSLIFSRLTHSSEKFSDKHKGETCYIIGDGPSVKWFDLTSFGDHPVICCGLLPFHKEFNQLDVRYCTMIEPWLFVPKYFRPNVQTITQYRKISKEYESIITNNPDIQFFMHPSNYFALSGENVNFMFKELPKSRNKTDDLLRQFDCFGGSFHAALTLAYYLGFKKIYLVGFDAWTIQPARNLHWYEFGEGVFFEPTNFATEFLNTLKTQLEICTISLDGNSRNVDCISYAAYTGKSPVFRENYEIIDTHHLNVLATYPGYRIYPEPASAIS